MNTDKVDRDLIRWFEELPETERYRFSSQWMQDEAAGISGAKLAKLLVDGRHESDAFVKSFRGFDLNKNKLKNVWRPSSGYSYNDVHQICNAINRYREKNGRLDRISAIDFYQRAWQELNQQYPLPSAQIMSAVVEQTAATPEPEERLIEPDQQPSAVVEIIETIVQQSSSSSLGYWLKIIAPILVVLPMVAFLFLPKNPALVVDKSLSYQQYLPGNVVQLRQLGQYKQWVTLDPPEHYLRAQDCYPHLASESLATNIVSYHQLEGLSLTALDRKTLLLPSLPINGLALHSSSITFAGLRRWNIGKGMFNLGISATCMASIQQVIDFGNFIEDYGIIKEAYVAEQIDFELIFTEEASESEVLQQSHKIADYFVGANTQITSGTVGQRITRQITVNGPLTVAYISQPMSARISK